MPELPEVETVCRSLRPHLLGQRIERIQVRDPRLRLPVNDRLLQSLVGRDIEAVERRAKYILLRLSANFVWLFHLGMSGKLISVAADTVERKHDHIIVSLGNGRQMRYHDPRRFGLSLVTRADMLRKLPQLRALGVDPFDGELTAEFLFRFTRVSKRRIRDLLLDQRIIAGLGNIYANEILSVTGIKPTTRAHRLSRKQVGAIASAIPRLLRDAIRWCGTSFSDYRDADDKSGEFQNHLRVYDRDGQKCRVCQGLIKRIAIGTRSAFYCPACQR